MKSKAVYEKGFRDGYIAGMKKGVNSAKQIVSTDLMGVYGALFIYLTEKYDFSQDQCSELTEATIELWSETGNPEKMAEKCLELTGMDLVQMMEDPREE